MSSAPSVVKEEACGSSNGAVEENPAIAASSSEGVKESANQEDLLLAEIQLAEIQLNRALLPKEVDYLSAKLRHDLLKAAPTGNNEDKKRLKAAYDKMNGLRRQLGESSNVLSRRKVPKAAAELQRQVRTPSFR